MGTICHDKRKIKVVNFMKKKRFTTNKIPFMTSDEKPGCTSSRQQLLHRCLQHLQRHCLLCHCPISPGTPTFGLCTHCQQTLPFIPAACQQCGIPLPVNQPQCGQCLQQSPAFDKTCCPLTYDGPVIPLIHRFKSSHSNALRRLLAEILLGKLHDYSNIDAITTVPMHWKRNLQRGNNHSLLLAQRLSRLLQIPFKPGIIHLPTLTLSQKNLSARQRRSNLQHAFQCHVRLQGQHIAVVDDVMTTGSTMQAVALALKQAGAAEVNCWVIARTPKQI